VLTLRNRIEGLNLFHCRLKANNASTHEVPLRLKTVI
jgi:hypothetical protein